MDRSDHEVELVEELVTVVELPVGEDVGLNPLQHSNTVERRIELVDLGMLRHDALA